MNKIEEEFFFRHKIDHEICIDLQGGKMTRYAKLWMEANNKKFAYNTFPCSKNLYHTIKNNKGQCIMCNSAKIAFQMREHKSGGIFILQEQNGAEKLKLDLLLIMKKGKNI